MDNEKNIRAIIERDFTGSLMNTTKWTEALDILQPLNLYYRVKLINESEPSHWCRYLQGGTASSYLPRGYIEGCGYSPISVLEIEWLEVQPADGNASDAEIERLLDLRNVPYTADGAQFRITGYARR